MFYAALARTLKRGAPLFHYTGAPNKLSSGRDLAGEVIQRLRVAGFSARVVGDGIVAHKL
jgi:predicted methyltransferase